MGFSLVFIGFLWIFMMSTQSIPEIYALHFFNPFLNRLPQIANFTVKNTGGQNEQPVLLNNFDEPRSRIFESDLIHYLTFLPLLKKTAFFTTVHFILVQF